MMVRLCEAILKDLGYRVFKAASGAEGLRTLLEVCPETSLLVTDIVMESETDGIDLAKAALAAHPNLNVIYMSGYANGPVVAEMLDRKSTLFLQKPFVVASLVEMVTRAEEASSRAG
ncbi:MAG: hypothetical protein JWP91_190 [Fibrobacteres bacterium]|nr:hypothetical protein [Fibrobacterota bacterium]